MRGWRCGSVTSRLAAALLVLLAASPVTAPFTTCDWATFIRDHVAHLAHVGHAGNVAPDTKTPSDPNTTTFVVIADSAIPVPDMGRDTTPRPTPLALAPRFSAVLRI